MPGETILIVDDDPDMVRVVSEVLRRAEYKTIVAETGIEALRQIYDKRPQLVILDVNLPDPKMNGLVVCRRIREVSNIPIVMLTSHGASSDVVQGFDSGADDYVVKPYEKNELLARLRAHLRRAATPPTINLDKNGILYRDSRLTVNIEERRVLRDGKPLRLSPIEFDLLLMLIKASPKVVTYRDLLQQVWGLEYINDLDYLRVYIWHLRRKLEDRPKEPEYLTNELGIGYRFEAKT